MHNKIWSKAYFEISRFMFSLKGSERTAIYSQALEFPTECAYNLYYDNIARHLAKRTLIYDPANQYAKSILLKLNK